MVASFPSTSLYVGDLHPDVTETHLFEVFKQIGALASIRLCRDEATRRSLGYAYVNFHTVSDAEKAMEALNFSLIRNRPCRIMWSSRDPSLRKSGLGNLFIKNLSPSIDNKSLFERFKEFGTILSCKVMLDEAGVSRGFGFVQFEKPEEANQAITKLNGTEIEGKQVFVGPIILKKERLSGKTENDSFTSVYVKNLNKDIDDQELQKIFSEFGTVTYASVMKNEQGMSREFGFVNFSQPQEARAAVEHLNGKTIREKVLSVTKAITRIERQPQLRLASQGLNLYIKNLDDGIDDEKLKEAFNSFGDITSAKVMKDDRGNSRGFGFVCFSAPEEANRALTEMNGRIMGIKPLYVAVAQTKDHRRRLLEQKYSEQQDSLVPNSVSNPHFYFPSDPLSGVPGLFRPGVPLFNGAPQRLENQFHPGGWSGALNNPPNYRGGSFQGGQRAKGGFRQKFPGSQNHGNKPGGNETFHGRNSQGASRREGQYVRNRTQPSLAHGRGSQAGRVVSNSERADQTDESKQSLGETLFQMVAVHEPERAAKITGMFLESLEWEELTQMVNTKEVLLSKIGEACQVLQTHVQEGEM